ncbi:MAG: IS481 family transposase [Asticcacaulis sp.]|nr:IS481 family transposase [Asticcacaulis sp.]
MPWEEVSIMDRRQEFARFAGVSGANVSALCRTFGISRKTGYKWLKRADEAMGLTSLEDRSRRPLTSPKRTSGTVEQSVLAVRDDHPAWGARKILHVLERDGIETPAPSTAHAILQRHGRITPGAREGKAFGRFEKEQANLLWQMDFKGQVRLGDGVWCYPLTIIDDHSRFSLCIEAVGNQRTMTVKEALERTFRTYGLPAAFYVDNGPPWGGGVPGQFTPLTVWLLKHDVGVIHAKPYSPQGRGKNERFHRSLKAEVLTAKSLSNLKQAQRAFDQWRTVYNHQRPHQALDMQVPASRYHPSARPMPSRMPSIEYDTQDIVRRIPKTDPFVSFKGKAWRVPKAFKGETVAIRQRNDDLYDVCFGATKIATIDLKPD